MSLTPAQLKKIWNRYHLDRRDGDRVPWKRDLKRVIVRCLELQGTEAMNEFWNS